jgi:hypothetical protein
MKGRIVPLICFLSLIAAIPGALISPDWGWIVAAMAIATVLWVAEEWK